MWQVVGHEETVALLDRSLRNRRLAHAYLFVGPRHVGKMRLAIEMAKALNCHHEERPCGVCTQCERIEGLKHADVQVIGVDGTTEIGIDQMRAMQHCASLKPFEGRHRVFIIDEVEHLSREAANCLLKTLEEPPADVQLVLLSTNDRLVLPTVLSRCHRAELRPLPIATVEKALIERWGVDASRAGTLARLSGGRLGWAVRAEGDDRVLQERSEKLAGLRRVSGGGRLERLAYAAELAGQFGRDRASVFDVLSLWTSWWRDVLLVESGCGDLISNVDHEEAVGEEARGHCPDSTGRFLATLQQTRGQLEQNANPRLALEVLMLRMPHRKGEGGPQA